MTNERLTDEEVLEAAKKILAERGRVTPTMLQIDFKVGYTRAKAAIDSLKPPRKTKEKE